MSVSVKICGIRDALSLDAAVRGGARYVGFVFAPSRRRVLPSEAEAMVAQVPVGITSVGLFVEPTDEHLKSVLARVPLGMIQLHGRETPERVAAVKALSGLPVIKALGVSDVASFEAVSAYRTVADMILFDAAHGERPAGGEGRAFDWMLLRDHIIDKPWILAGGLNADNVAEAVAKSGAKIVDISTGVEDPEGKKDPHKIRAFLKVAEEL